MVGGGQAILAKIITPQGNPMKIPSAIGKEVTKTGPYWNDKCMPVLITSHSFHLSA